MPIGKPGHRRQRVIFKAIREGLTFQQGDF
jgi:hypothetical protein